MSLDQSSGRSIPGESPLPRYGLAGSFVGERLREGEAWDTCSIVHRPAIAGGELSVTVTRRTTATLVRGARRVTITADGARRSVAIGLVLDNSSTEGDVFEVAEEIASDTEAWKAREIMVDGEVVVGSEREFGDRWIAYYLTPLLIVSVLAPVTLRPDALELRRLYSEEIESMDMACLSDLEGELLELCVEVSQMSATTTSLNEKLMSNDCDRSVVEAALCGLVAQGLMITSRRVVAGREPSRDGCAGGDSEDWWVVTAEGCAAIGLPDITARNDD